MFAVKVQNSFNTLPRVHALYVKDMRAGGQGPMRRALERASAVYMQSMLTRFTRFSMGGGDWAPLAKRTIEKKGHDSILVDTDQLRRSLNPSGLRHGGLLAAGHSGFKVGIPSGIDHFTSKLAVDQLAKVHHLGKGSRRNGYNLPARPILVSPSPSTYTRMNKEIMKGLQELVKKAK